MGETRADEYYQGLFDAFNLISAHPLASRERYEIEASLRLKIVGGHLVIYEVENNEIIILRIVHGHYDWQNEL